MKVHEDLIVFAPGKTVYNPQMEAGKPYARKTDKPEGYVGRVNTHKYAMKPRTEFSNEGTRYPKSVLNFPRDFSAQQQDHPTRKATTLLEYLVRTYSNENAVVLDNCMGTGQTGVACARAGRKFIGMELEESYFVLAKNKIEEAYRGI
mgnify:CR=1 FL=1